jgi:hypothetical protein
MEPVELSEFISNALTEIAQGIKKANDTLKDSQGNRSEVFSLRRNIGDNSKIPGIRFDIAVTAASYQKDKAGFFVALASIGGGANTEKQKENEQVHRIQFEIGIDHKWS